MSNLRAVALLLFAIALQAPTCQPPNPDTRGTWWYKNGNGMNPDPSGTEQRVLLAGSAAELSAAADAIADCGVRRVYGSYGSAIAPSGGSLSPEGSNGALFNEALHARQMESQVLFSEGVSQLADWSNLLDKIQARVLDFNAAVPLVNRFDGVHLDVEPHAGSPSACKLATLDLAECRALFGLLLDLVGDVRALLDSSPVPLRLHVDLPEWASKLPGAVPPESNVRIGWAGAADRDAWFATLDGLVDRVSIFAYADDDLASILDKVAWEVDHLASEVRVSLDVDYETAAPFDSWGEMDATAQALEALGYVVDLHSTNELQAASGFSGCL